MEQKQTRIIVGRHAVAEALAPSVTHLSRKILLLDSQHRSVSLMHLEKLAYQIGLKVNFVKRSRLDFLSAGIVHQGAILILDYSPLYIKLDSLLDLAYQAGTNGLLLMADHLQDSYNLGAIMRSAAAVSAQGIIIPRNRSCPITIPAVAKSAAGAFGEIPICRVTNLRTALQRCKVVGLWTLAAITHSAVSPWELDLKRPLVLVIGSEHKGVKQLLFKNCDMLATLPLAPNIDSLNVSVATGIFLFEIARQRTKLVNPIVAQK